MIVLGNDVMWEVNMIIGEQLKVRKEGIQDGTHVILVKFSSTCASPPSVATQRSDTTSHLLLGRCSRWPVPSHQSGYWRLQTSLSSGTECDLPLARVSVLWAYSLWSVVGLLVAVTGDLHPKGDLHSKGIAMEGSPFLLTM